MRKIIFTTIAVLGLFIVLSIPVIAQTEVSNVEEEKMQEYCEKSGGTWTVTTECVEPEYMKPGTDQCEEIGYCECPTGYEESVCGACVETLDWGTIPEDQETCETGGGTWVTDGIEGETVDAVSVDNEDIVDDIEGEGDDDDEVMITENGGDEEIGFCECPAGSYWSSNDMCEEFELSYLCSSTCGTWDDTAETCECWDETAVWTEDEGCYVEPTTLKQETTAEDTGTNESPETEEKEGITLQPLVLGGALVGVLVVGILLGFVLKPSKKQGITVPQSTIGGQSGRMG